MAARTFRHRALRAAAFLSAIALTAGILAVLDEARSRASRGELIVLNLGDEQ